MEGGGESQRIIKVTEKCRRGWCEGVCNVLKTIYKFCLQLGAIGSVLRVEIRAFMGLLNSRQASISFREYSDVRQILFRLWACTNGLGQVALRPGPRLSGSLKYLLPHNREQEEWS